MSQTDPKLSLTEAARMLATSSRRLWIMARKGQLQGAVQDPDTGEWSVPFSSLKGFSFLRPGNEERRKRRLFRVRK